MGTPRSRLDFKINVARHLLELGRLVGREVSAAELLSLQDTGSFRERSARTRREPSWRFGIPFAEKECLRFRKLVRSLDGLVAIRVYVWTPLAIVCGLLRPVPLAEVNWEFSIDAIREGVFALVTEDLANKVLVEWSNDTSGEPSLEFELSGPDWGMARY